MKISHKIAAGLGLSLLAPLCFDAAALAAPVGVRGTVTNINGDQVTLKQPWGDEITITIAERKLTKPFVDPLIVGNDIAVVMYADKEGLIARKYCRRIPLLPPFVPVQPIVVPEIGAAPAARPYTPYTPPEPMTPPPTKLLW
jgi:hypothetical protein